MASVGFAPLLAASLGTATPPTFTLDLSLPARDRWAGALALVAAEHPWDASWGPIFAEHNASLFDHMAASDFAALGDALDVHYAAHADELRGIADQFGTVFGQSVSYEYLAAWVYYHELAHTTLMQNAAAYARECTGIVAQDAEGRIHHIANMDQSPEAVRNVTLSVRFVRNASAAPVLLGVDWYWFTTGVSRVVSPGLASVQENWRTTTKRTLADVLADAAAGVVPQILLFRDTLLRQPAPPPSFDALVARFRTVRLAAPFYIVAAGARTGEGVVIARNLTGVDGSRRLGPSSSSFYLAQTNYDAWLPDPAADPRRTVAERTMRGFGEAVGASELGLMAAASSFPVHNPHTAYTAYMRAATGTLVAFVRDAMCPENAQDVTVDSRYCQPARVHNE